VARADELTRTDAERACLSALRDATGAVDDPMERHCVRLFLIAERMAADRDIELDRELVLCASFIHDLGIYPEVSTGDVYLADSRRLGERTLAPFGWDAERMAKCLDAIEQHHARHSRWDWGAEVELVRRADLVEVTAGQLRFGVERDWIRRLFRELPRKRFYLFIALALVGEALTRPRNLPRIFTPPREPTRV
jgi:HD domain